MNVENEHETQEPTTQTNSAAQNIERTDGNRTIGHGIILAYTAFAVVDGAFVLAGHLEAWRGIMVLGFAFFVLFLGDIGIQRADMNDGDFF